MRRFLMVALCGLGLAGCDVPVSGPVSGPAPGQMGQTVPGTGMTVGEAARSFADVVAAVEPVAEAECRARAPRVNCDYLIQVDADRSAPANAFQSLDSAGRPVITFTVALIASAENADELAFVMSHEAAHHIREHLARQRRNAEAGAVVFAGLATLTGGTTADVATAQRLGAAVGARSYSKEFELEADELGTVIAVRAGYNPLIGAGFFTKIPDPGDKFLGTHPPNGDRLAVVRRTAAQLGFN